MSPLAPGALTVDNASPADVDLVRDYLATGDEACFAALVERYRDRVFRLACSILGPGAAIEAEDVAQEVFVLVHRKLGGFRSESAFSSWLYRIAQRRALEHRRRARHRYPHHGDAVLATLVHIAPGPDREHRLALYAAVEALSEPLRSTIYLHYWLGESVADIAELRGARPGTVKAQLHRARKRLARLLETDHV